MGVIELHNYISAMIRSTKRRLKDIEENTPGLNSPESSRRVRLSQGEEQVESLTFYYLLFVMSTEFYFEITRFNSLLRYLYRQ